MLRPAHRLLVLALVAGVSSVSLAQAAPAAPRPKPGKLPNDSMEIGRRYAQWLLTSLSDSLVAHEGGDRKGTRADYDQTAIQLAARAGTEVKVLEEKFITRNNLRQYWRTSEFTSMTEPLLLRFVISEKGELMGMGAGPKSQAPPIDP
ncbi:MAG: hypothetical protein ABIY52_14865 [Gemmatimonadaceae bacterium]